jgi:hypothetical protein
MKAKVRRMNEAPDPTLQEARPQAEARCKKESEPPGYAKVCAKVAKGFLCKDLHCVLGETFAPLAVRS